MAQRKPGALSAALCNASMLMYTLWLLLPAVQTTLRAVTGVAAVGLFGVGVALDGQTLPRHWRSFLPRVGFALLLPLALFFLLERGGGNLPGYYAQQGMFWFAPLWCAYARERGDQRVTRWVAAAFMAALVLTTLTTIGWLVQGMLRGGKVYAYARSLGSGAPDREAYLKELMGRNIGGYDFVYASVLLLPVTFALALQWRGWRRAAAVAFYGAQLAMIGLSQYTYAILFAAAVTAMELLALLLRRVFRRLSVGASLLWTLPFFAALWMWRVPLIRVAQGVAAGIGFQNATYSLEQLLAMLTGGAMDAGTRLDAYTVAWQGFAASPLVGSMLGGARQLGLHSDLLDLLSGLGLLGTAAFAMGAWVIGRGTLSGIGRSPQRAHLALQWALLLVCMALGTVFYSREIPLAMGISAGLLLWEPPLGG